MREQETRPRNLKQGGNIMKNTVTKITNKQDKQDKVELNKKSMRLKSFPERQQERRTEKMIWMTNLPTAEKQREVDS